MRNAVQSVISNPFKILFCLFIAGASIGLLATPYYALAPLPALGTILIMLLGRYPKFGFYLIVFLIPFGAYRHKADWFIALYLLIILFFHILTNKKIPENMGSKLWPWILPFFAVSLISACLSRYPVEGFHNLLLLLVGYVFFALSLFFISPSDLRKTLLLVIVWSTAICSFSALIGYFFDVPYFAEKVYTDGFKRGIGTSTDPNGLSLIIIFSIPFFVHLIFYASKRIMRYISLILLLINLIAMVTTFSRSGAMILLLILIGLIFEHKRRLRPRFLGILMSGVALALVLLFLLTPASYYERVMSITERGDVSIGRRASYLLVGWDAFKKRPLLGSGPGTFRDIFSTSKYALIFEKKGKESQRFAHNTYLEVLVGTGILGMFIFLYLLLHALRDFSRARKAFRLRGDNEMTSLIGTYRMSFFSLLIVLLTFSDLYQKYLMLTLAISQVALRLSQEDLYSLKDNEIANSG